MSRELRRGGKQDKGDGVGEKVVVAVKASSNEIPKTALVWALTHVVQPGNCITLVAVVSSHCFGIKFLGFPRFGPRKSNVGITADQKSDITNYCSQMILQLHEIYDPNKINVKIKVVSGTPCGAVAAEAKKSRANWVVLDKKLKHEAKRCMEELQCNIVVMKRSHPKVLRLNLIGSPLKEPERKKVRSTIPFENNHLCRKVESKVDNSLNLNRGHLVTPSSSPDTFTTIEVGTSSVSSSDPGTSPFSLKEKKKTLKKEKIETNQDQDLDESGSDSDNKNLSPSPSPSFQPWMAQIVTSFCRSSHHPRESPRVSRIHTASPRFGSPSYRSSPDFNGNLREAISFSRTGPLGPPPLCSVCQHKAPEFGKPPRWFTYEDLELATGGFSRANFLAEGGFGSVHRGVLPDGQAIAVKQHKLASSQGDQEFCSEVEVLSCAQHRNVVMLIGFCIEDGRRLLVYEYICNGSLDSHLYGSDKYSLSWKARRKIAIGAARGLRYLHEECRVGCIVHRDMRPNNILITHDFEPLVGDFGLARWQPDGETGVETRVIGTLGYLAPEYAQSGQITEKADVYSFGVVLVELVTGRKAVDINRPRGQQCLAEWARPLLEAYAVDELIDPRLRSNYSNQEVRHMLHAASLCLSWDPQTRPRMSRVLRILEGNLMDSGQISTTGVDAGLDRRARHARIGSGAYELSGPFSSKLSLTSKSSS